MSKPGWYPDPGGQPGMFRWWDGVQWTPHVSPNPFAPQGPQQPLTPGTSQQPGASQEPQQPAYQGLLPMRDGAQRPTYSYDSSSGRNRGGLGAIAVLGLVGLLVVGIIIAAINLLGGGFNPFERTAPASNPTGNVCPTQRATVATPKPHTAGPGRTQGGKLSYPTLGSPWSSVMVETRVPFGRDVYGQSVMVENNYDGRGSSWVASVVVGELVAGDGFFSPQDGADIVARCVMGVFYADATLDRRDVTSRAITVDGHDAWMLEMHLGFNIPRLNEKGETAIIVIVDTGEESASLYYASIPDSRPELLTVARQVQGQLRVEA